MILIDLDGHADCASVLTAGAHNATAEPITNVRRVSFLISRPWSCCFLSSREDRSDKTSEERGCVTCGTVSTTKQVTSIARKTNSHGGFLRYWELQGVVIARGTAENDLQIQALSVMAIQSFQGTILGSGSE
ncbi:hypothetical protein [Bradyrhizobium yuanmingense]|uniref:hypothetical protein n=1 Tax=Bradyrhizobium yuanmingense TaxID=108015 RepID=UPI0012FCEDAE|nr:hypothetical protein [Bradyrhizobium yuanmingense]MDF0496181.1 hypothetical protein [Bradyrhizobium yuanmingense]MDF0584276.1 hypothetical protein [Bradyrhizobium yuanmingense]